MDQGSFTTVLHACHSGCPCLRVIESVVWLRKRMGVVLLPFYTYPALEALVRGGSADYKAEEEKRPTAARDAVMRPLIRLVVS